MALAPHLQAAIFLRNAAPQQWDEFVKAFELHVYQTTMSVIQADAAHIMTAKGAAIHAQSLYEDFVNLDRYQRPPAPAV